MPRVWRWCCPPCCASNRPRSRRSWPSSPSGYGTPAGEDKALRIEEAIIRTEQFFQQMGVGTRLADYGLSESCIPGICSNLKRSA
jgi:hypothetical protein